MDEGCTQPLSSDPMINLNTTAFLCLSIFPFVRNLHTLESLALTIKIPVIKCAETECGALRMLKVCLGSSSMRLGSLL
jgi:hypothetical protein